MLTISEHAVDRYVERWRPTATRDQARDEIAVLIASSSHVTVEHQPYGSQAVRVARLGARPVHLVVVEAAGQLAVRTVLPEAGVRVTT